MKQKRKAVNFLEVLNNELIKKIEETFNEKIISKKALTTEVTLLSFKNQKLIVKKVSKKTNQIYEYLRSSQFLNALYPIKKIIDNKAIFYLFNYLNSYEYPGEKKIIDMISVIKELHEKTSFNVKLEESNFKYFYRIYRKLDNIFQTLEMFVRESEVKDNKSDFDWIILSKYHIFLDCKTTLYNLQRKIHKYLDNKGIAMYSLCHGNLTLDHFRQNKLLSFDHAYIGFFVSDYAKFYVSIDHISGDYLKQIDKILSEYSNEFYLLYFKFMVLYIYMINLRLDSFYEYATINVYLELSKRIAFFLKYVNKK